MAASVAMAVLVAAALASDVTETWAEYKARMDNQVKRNGKSPIKITPGKEFGSISSHRINNNNMLSRKRLHF